MDWEFGKSQLDSSFAPWALIGVTHWAAFSWELGWGWKVHRGSESSYRAFLPLQQVEFLTWQPASKRQHPK